MWFVSAGQAIGDVDRSVDIIRPASLFVMAGVFFALYATLRPYGSDTGVDTVAEFASTWWLVSHSCAVVGFVVTFAAVADVARSLSGTPGGPTASWAAIITGIGGALVLPYYGAETFALHALGASAVADGVTGELAEAEAIRFGVLASVTFGGGLLLLVIGALTVALAVRRARGPLALVVPYVVAWALFPVQFYTPATVRMSYGVLVLAAFVALAIAASRLRRSAELTA